jgi:hypothetical protein
MTKKAPTSTTWRFIGKLIILVISFLGLLFCFYLLINKDGGKVSYWKKIQSISNINIFKFFGWWNLLIFGFILVAGILYKYPFLKLIIAQMERKKFIEFSKGVHMAVVSADVGKGKTLLLSILARSIKRSIKKIGFVSNVADAQLVGYNDINFEEPIPEKETYRLPKHYFLDEMNFMIEGVNFRENQLYHKGVAWLLQILRHHKMHVWMSGTRDNHIWVQVRQMMNYYIKLGGLKPLMNLGRFQFSTQRVQFYSQTWELEQEFNILISNLDFELYDSYWLGNTRYFRPTFEGLAEKGRKARLKKEQERQKQQEYEAQKREKIKSLVKVLEAVKLQSKNKPLVNKEEIKTEISLEPKKEIKLDDIFPKMKVKKKGKWKKSSLQDFLDNYDKNKK